MAKIYKPLKCPKCGSKMHKIYKKNLYVCENWKCVYKRKK